MIFKRKNKNEKLLEHALEFFEEENGEVDLAYYAILQKVPYIPPVNKFIEWLEEKGHKYNVNKEEIKQILLKALKIRLMRRST